MIHDLVVTLYFFMCFSLVAFNILFILSGIDDVFLDFIYWIRYANRKRKARLYPPLTYEQLLDFPEKPIAVLIPCWQEANVIGNMLQCNCNSIDYKNYVLFVGVYPNDKATVAEVEAIARTTKHVQCVIGEKPGPTNKASNLNQIYRAVKAFEEAHQQEFAIILFHDSEDVIHPLSFKLYNYLIPRKDMIQLPVFPMKTPLWNFTHWLYIDEFSENHTKNMVVREAIKLHVPSAGVGTAFARSVIVALEKEGDGHPFSERSLTEDYRTSLMVRTLGFKQIFLTQSVLRTEWVRKGLFKKQYKKKITHERVATRAMFPTSYFQAVRQKTRWIIGIVFQEWEDSLWPKSWRLRYSLAHDRKAFVTHFINGFAYIILFFWITYTALTAGHPTYPSLHEQFKFHPWVWWLFSISIFMMIERLVQRFIATTRLYGILGGVLSIPRTCYGNVLNLHALIRAYVFYFISVKNNKKKKTVAWDKTDHHFPGRHILVPHRLSLGQLLIEQGRLTEAQLEKVIIEQRLTGERLGEVIVKFGWMTEEELLPYIATQYQLPLIPQSECEREAKRCAEKLPKKIGHWLSNEEVVPIRFDELAAEIVFGISDPTNELLLKRMIQHLSSYRVRFALIQPGH